jgi:hypothetical protein
MIFAHAPMILPAVLKLKVNPFSRVLYIWFIFLQATLLLRVSGVFTGNAEYKQLAGMLNGIAIIGFFVTVIILTRFAKRRAKINALTAAAIPAGA